MEPRPILLEVALYIVIAVGGLFAFGQLGGCAEMALFLECGPFPMSWEDCE